MAVREWISDLFRKVGNWTIHWCVCLYSQALQFKENFDEITTYLTESIGNPVRIDYGTGHELSFIAFLLSLFKVGYLKQVEHMGRGSQSGSSTELNDYAATALCILPAYLRLVRHLQTYFRMEPAGSHGVWSLDDFQFVPYIWGSSQLIGMAYFYWYFH